MQCHHKESSLVAHKQAKQYVPTEIWQWLLSGSDCGSKQGSGVGPVMTHLTPDGAWRAVLTT